MRPTAHSVASFRPSIDAPLASLHCSGRRTAFNAHRRRHNLTRIVLDPVPLVLGIYAYVGELLSRTAEKREDDAAEALGRRFSRQRAAAGDREAQRMVRTLHTDVKTADKLLKKTSDVWKISQETDLVDLVILP